MASGIVQAWKTLDWGERGGRGGAMRAYQKWFCTTLYILVITEDQESRRMRSFLRSFLVYFYLLDLASCNLRVREDFLY